MEEEMLQRQENAAGSGGSNGAFLASLLQRIATGDRAALRRL